MLHIPLVCLERFGNSSFDPLLVFTDVNDSNRSNTGLDTNISNDAVNHVIVLHSSTRVTLWGRCIILLLTDFFIIYWNSYSYQIDKKCNNCRYKDIRLEAMPTHWACVHQFCSLFALATEHVLMCRWGIGLRTVGNRDVCTLESFWFTRY